MSEALRTVHVRIEGHVQGVGYRAWAARNAAALGLAGWVRNRYDGAVEAVFAGAADAVAAMLARCERGPFGSRVDRIQQLEESGSAPEGFSVLPTV